jgi:hypothetical protein
VAEQQQPKFRIQDNPSIIEIYANKFLGAVFDGSAVNLTFGSLRLHLENGSSANTGPATRCPDHPSLDALASGSHRTDKQSEPYRA